MSRGSVAGVALGTAPIAAIALGGWLAGSLAAAVVQTLAALVVLALVTTVGTSILRWVGLPDATAVERTLMSVTAGTGAVGLLVVLLGAAGALYPGTVTGALLGAAGAAALHTRPWRRARAVWVDLVDLASGPPALGLLVAATLFLGIAIAASIVPPWDWDTLMYHIPVPAAFLDRGTVFAPPVIAHDGYVGSVHALYVVALALEAPQSITALSALFAVLLGLAVLTVARRELPPGPAALAVTGLAGSTILAFVAITPRIDAALALFLLLAHCCVLRLARGGSGRYLLAAALFGGTALATKLHAGAYLLPLAAWVAWLAVRGRVQPRHLALGAGVGLVVGGPWLVRNAVLFGDPLFPLLTDPLVPPWLADDPRIVDAARSVTGGVLGSVREPVTLGRLLFDPEALSPELAARYYVWSPLLLVGVLVALVTPAVWSWAVPAAAYVALLLAWSTRTNLRYLIPALPALSVAAAAALHRRLPAGTAVRKLGGPVLYALSLAPLALALAMTWTWIRRPIESGRYDAIYAAAAAASEAVPPEGAVLMLYESRTLPFDRTAIPDTRLVTWPLLQASGHAAECLRRLPVSHVLINAGAVEFYRDRAGALQHVDDGALDRFVERCLEPVAERGPLRLYRLVPGRAGP